MGKKFLYVILWLMVCFLNGCGNSEETIEGKWVLTQQIHADGTVLEEDELTAYECYEVNGDRASYTCIADPIGERNMEFQVEQVSDKEYNFRINDRLVFSTARLDGEQFTYVLGEGNDAVTFVFSK